MDARPPQPTVDPERFERCTGVVPTEMQRLAQVPLFAHLDANRVRDLLIDSAVRGYEDGAMLFTQGEPADRFFVVLDGWVKLVRQRSDGHEAVIAAFTAGESFAEAAMFESGNFPVTALVVGRSRVLSVPAGPLKAKLRNDSELAFDIMASMSVHLRRLVRQVEQLTLQSSEQRVAAFLVRLASVESGPAVVRLPVDKALVAGRLGMQPETFSRSLSRLKDRGIAVEARDISIPDVGELRRLAGGDEDAA